MIAETDWKKEKLAVLLEAAGHAISRARYVFLISNIAGIVILTGLFNSTFPWIRNALEFSKQNKPELASHLQKVLYEDFWTLSVPLLGVKISVFDLSVFGPTALLIIAIWQYYSVRREHEIVVVVTNEAKKVSEDRECVAYLYHGIAHHFVFTTRFYTDAASNKRNVGATVALTMLFFMPAWVPLLIVLSDLYSLFLPYLLSPTPGAATFHRLDVYQNLEAAARTAYSAAIGLTSLYYCVQCRTLDRDSRSNLETMKSLIG